MEKFYKFDKRLLGLPISIYSKVLYMLLSDMQRAADNNKSLPMSAKGCAKVRQQTLAIKLQVSDRQIRKITRELQACGLIVTDRAGNGITTYYVQDISMYTPPDELQDELTAQQAIQDIMNGITT